MECWAAEWRFRGKPGPEELFEYTDIRLLPDMAKEVEVLLLPLALKPFVDFCNTHFQNLLTGTCFQNPATQNEREIREEAQSWSRSRSKEEGGTNVVPGLQRVGR